MATDPTVSAEFVILGYCRRWSVELAFFDSKQFLGLHDPQVWSERSVERAHPMAWFVGSLTILWYCLKGHEGSHVERERPWYKHKVTPTFTDMLGALRLQMWEYEIYGESGEEQPSPECIKSCSTRCRRWLEVRKSSQRQVTTGRRWIPLPSEATAAGEPSRDE